MQLSTLKTITGNGTSMVSLIIPPNNNLQLTINRMEAEYNTAANIKDKINRQSVQSSLKSAIFALKSMKNLPLNGCAIYTNCL